MSNDNNDETIYIPIEVTLQNGLLVRRNFEFPKVMLNNCIVHAEGWQYAVELTHQCQNRRHLYQELHRLLPTLVHKDDFCWFQTLNKKQATQGACLFPGAQLQIRTLSETETEFGFCFSRSAFSQERARFVMEDILSCQNGSVSLIRRRPSDHERLLVNKDGWEILYVIRVGSNESLTYTDLRDEASLALQVDKNRISLVSGPFTWTPSFQEDGCDFYRTYFTKDIVTDGVHMKTARGAALVAVVESVPPQIMGSI